MRPLGVGELLDAAIKVCTAHAGTLVRAVLVVVVPLQLLSALVLLSTIDDPDTLTSLSGSTAQELDATYFAGQVVVTILGSAAFLVATGACFRAIAEAWLGRTPSWRESLRFGARRALPLLWLSILYTLGVLLGFLALIVPGVFLAIAWVVSYPVLFVEDLRGGKALRRSMDLVRGRFWPTFGVVLLGFVLAGIVSAIFTFGFQLLVFIDDSVLFAVLLTTVGTLIATALTTPFQAALVALVYFDLRVRKEGLDLELLAQRLGGGEPVLGTAGLPPAPPPGVPAGPPAAVPGQSQPPFWPPPPGWTPGPAQPGHAPAGWLPPGAPDPGERPAPGDAPPSGPPPGWAPPTPGGA